MEYTAKQLFDMIGSAENPVKWPKNPREDRKLRKMVYEAQINGRPIINSGSGYYEADLKDEGQRLEAKHYVNTKKSRIRKHAASIQALERLIDNVDQISIESYGV